MRTVSAVVSALVLASLGCRYAVSQEPIPYVQTTPEELGGALGTTKLQYISFDDKGMPTVKEWRADSPSPWGAPRGLLVTGMPEPPRIDRLTFRGAVPGAVGGGRTRIAVGPLVLSEEKASTARYVRSDLSAKEFVSVEGLALESEAPVAVPAYEVKSNLVDPVTHPGFARSFLDRYSPVRLTVTFEGFRVLESEEDEMEVCFAYGHSEGDNKVVLQKQGREDIIPGVRAGGEPTLVRLLILEVPVPAGRHPVQNVSVILNAYEEDGEALRTDVGRFVSDVKEQGAEYSTIILGREDLAALEPQLPVVGAVVDAGLYVWSWFTQTDALANVRFALALDEDSLYSPRLAGFLVNVGLTRVGWLPERTVWRLEGASDPSPSDVLEAMKDYTVLRYQILASAPNRLDALFTVDIEYRAKDGAAD